MGKLYGIGIGPGDPELLTLKAYRILREADVIFCPEKKAGAGSVAYEIVKGLLEGAGAKIVPLVYPMHYSGEKLLKVWEENGEQIAACLNGGKTGAFITLGDPSVYSTFMYTLPYIEKHGISVEVVPGVPSFCAAAAASKTPLAAWDETLTIAPVRGSSGEDLGRLLRENDNVVLMKPSADKAALLSAIRENNMEDRFVLVIKAGTDEEILIRDIRELEQYDIPYLSTMIIKHR
ncbi:MAG TPA: precorrin-2 C(20)-methyltransferase [Candidatus Lachnoclostridium stercoravium]|uniref:Precorrin-2 C(20)-methyltransferase n=1 Tax=Candidatus Lachnoclostridium stercoravium TaxID=2838633 RepID=A0A9D2KLM7_9FIRM|nr:precorrin-2 C(20)-methyltransferase [Candidatus Lachnoclostridium stercoravium]